MDSQNKVCETCKASLTEDNKLKVSFGNPMTRERMYVRVCQYVKDRPCINSKKPENFEDIKVKEGYG